MNNLYNVSTRAMQKSVILSSMFLLFGNILFGATQDDRFKGGSCDGYDRTAIMQYFGVHLKRFNGGGVDGYDNTLINDSVFPDAGCFFTFF